MTTRTGLPRRLARRAKWAVLRLRRITVREVTPDLIRVSRLSGVGWRSYRLDDPAARHVVRGARLRLLLPDPAALVRLAVSGLLAGNVRWLRVRLRSAPEWLVRGVRPPRLGRTADRFRWRRRRGRLTLELGWSSPYAVSQALAGAVAAVLRARPWDQASGPVYLLNRTAWLDQATSWPQGRLGEPPAAAVESDPAGRPLGPYLPSEPPTETLPPPLLTTLANPFGRILLGAATRYRLATEPERLLLRDERGRVVLRLGPDQRPEAAVAAATIARYAVVTVEPPLRLDRFAHGLRTLAACGIVFAAAERTVRAELDAFGLVTVAQAKEVDDLPGYHLSVRAARQLAIAGDAALRRTALAGAGTLPLPAVSMLLSSMRPDHVETCLAHLATQTYPAAELLVGLHGYEVPEATEQRWRSLVRLPTRVVRFPSEVPFGAVLGQLSRLADGELVTKVDDDDHYGRDHLTDLVLAWHTSGADVAAKGCRFVHFPELGETIDRAWAAPELFDVTPAGGTLLLSRGTLQQVGGWSHASKHVDTDLLIRIRSAGGLVYRTHALEYVYTRRTSGHTFDTRIEDLAEQGERVYHGFPEAVLNPGRPTP